MSDNNEIIKSCMTFRDCLVSNLKDVSHMIEMIIPLNDDDKKTLQKGMGEIDSYIEKLSRAETIRDLNRYIDVNAVISDFGEISDSISQINAYQFSKFMNNLEVIINDEQ